MMHPMPNVERHELSSLFARHDLKRKPFQDLVDDIKTNGLLFPITTFEEKILDGWNRYQACLEAGVEPRYCQLTQDQDPWSFVKGSNMLRRHMTPRQRVAIFLLKDSMHRVECSKLNTPSVREIQDDIGVSVGTAQKAQIIALANNPELTEAVVENRISVGRAAEVAKLPEREQHAALEAPETRLESRSPDGRDSRIAQLLLMVDERDAELTDLREQLLEMADALQTAQTDNERMAQILDANDLREEFAKEVHRSQEQARVTQSRNDGLMNENADLIERLKSARRKTERLEKKAEGSMQVEAEKEYPVYELEEDE